MFPFNEVVLAALCKAYVDDFYRIVSKGDPHGFSELHQQGQRLKRRTAATEADTIDLQQCRILDEDDRVQEELRNVYFLRRVSEIIIRIRTTTKTLALPYAAAFLPNAHIHLIVKKVSSKEWRVTYHVTDEVPNANINEGRCFTHSEMRECAISGQGGHWTMRDVAAPLQPRTSNGEGCRAQLVNGLGEAEAMPVLCTPVVAELLSGFGRFLTYIVDRYNYLNAIDPAIDEILASHRDLDEYPASISMVDNNDAEAVHLLESYRADLQKYESYFQKKNQYKLHLQIAQRIAAVMPDLLSGIDQMREEVRNQHAFLVGRLQEAQDALVHRPYKPHARLYYTLRTIHMLRILKRLYATFRAA